AARRRQMRCNFPPGRRTPAGPKGCHYLFFTARKLLHTDPSTFVVILFSIFYICSICFVQRAYCTKHEAVFWRVRRKPFTFVVDFVFDAATACRITETHRCFSLLDRKSTRLNSSHVSISYAVFC